ncbi:MAG: hypothetical protein AAF191_20770, partial [Verrucomicrobiota bacterium]
APPRETSPGEDGSAEAEGEGKDAEFIGLSLKEGESLAKQKKLAYRTVEIDGESLVVTMDYDPNRVNVSIAKGKIIKVTRG